MPAIVQALVLEMRYLHDIPANLQLFSGKSIV
jgi:hypothetical protein